MTYQLYNEDCLEAMKRLPSGSVDMVMADLPYGTTACKWDTVIPFAPLWEQYKRLCRGAIVLTASQPFTSVLVCSNLEMFKYCWVWDKVNRYTGALLANKMPMKRHEDVAIFYSSQPVYNKQFRTGKAYNVKRTGGHGEHNSDAHKDQIRFGVNDGEHHNPCSVLEIKGDNKKEHGAHPTQKPVALMEYLIRTYTNPGCTVLDNTMGSGTTGVACMNTGRNFIGMEKDLEHGYFQIAQERIKAAYELNRPRPLDAEGMF